MCWLYSEPSEERLRPQKMVIAVELSGLLADEYVSHVLKSFPWYQRFARRHFERPRWLGKAW